MDEFLKLAAQAAEKLGVEAARLWPQIVLITYAKAWFWLIVDVLFLVAVPISACKTIKGFWKEVTIDSKDGEFTLAISVITGVVAAIIMAIAFFTIPDQIAAIVAPEAVTVLRLLGK